MRVLKACRLLALMAFGLLAGVRAEAQFFGLAVSNSPNPVMLNGTLTITILVTNETGTLAVQITNAMPSSAMFLNATNSTGGPVTSSNGNTVFSIPSFNIGQVATLTVQVQPTVRGSLTNIVTIATLGSTNVTSATNVTPVVTSEADLAVSISGPTMAVLANDWMTYGVSITNLGPNTSHNVVVSNSLPAGVAFISAASLNYSVTSNAVFFNVGNLASGTGTNLSLTLQPTNAGVLPLVAAVGSTDFNDPNPSNNLVTNIVNVGAFDTTQLAASNTSAQTLDPQSGLMKQTIGVSNIGTNVAASSRVVVSGLSNVLVNAVGTNNGNPFVQYNGALAPGSNVSLVLEYLVPSRQPIVVPNSAYAAVPIGATVMTNLPAGSLVGITVITNLPSGALMIEFPSVPGRSYTIVYADNPAMTNALVSLPPVIAPADRTQWIDFGPPNTVSAPTSVSNRFYSVILNP